MSGCPQLTPINRRNTAFCHTEGKRKFRRITLSINQFIPKPRTPLQWCALAGVHDAGKKIINAFHQDKQIHVIADVPKWNYVQALLSLGDRRVGDILLAVHRLTGNWMKALKEVNLNPDFYVYRQKDLNEVLPWDIKVYCLSSAAGSKGLGGDLTTSRYVPNYFPGQGCPELTAGMLLRKLRDVGKSFMKDH